MLFRVSHYGIVGLCCVLAASLAAGGEPPRQAADLDPVVTLLELVIDADSDTAGRCLAILTEKIQNREVSQPRLEALRARLDETLKPILQGPADGPLYVDAALLAASWQDPVALEAVRDVLGNPADHPDERRLQALRTLTAAGDSGVLEPVAAILARPQSHSTAFRAATLAALARLDQPQVASLVLEHYDRLEAELQPQAVELLTGRSDWARQLLQAIRQDQIPAHALNVNQVRNLLSSRDQQLNELVTATWGTLRTERDPQREQVIAQMRELIGRTAGDPHRGQQIFHKVCGQCHTIHGQGHDVGPDITSNGRGSFDQLLSNVFDPSLVIGAAYQAHTVITTDGRVLSGLLAEDNDRRVVLKLQGGKLETVARQQIDEMQVSRLSLMPEGLENQLQPQEIADLFAFLTLDKPPNDDQARPIPGTPATVHNTRDAGGG